MKAKALAIAGLCGLAVALALPAGVVAATPTVTRVKGSEHNPSFNICGLDLTTDFTFTAVEVVKTSGVSLNAGEFTAVWTNPATGKSIVIHAGQMGMTSARSTTGTERSSSSDRATGPTSSKRRTAGRSRSRRAGSRPGSRLRQPATSSRSS